MIVYNTTNSEIFITTKFRPDPQGGPAIRETDYCVRPGQGIDLEIVGLVPEDEKLSLEKLQNALAIIRANSDAFTEITPGAPK